MRSLLLFLLFGAVTPLVAQWRSLNGPPGADGRAIAAAGNEALLATPRGAYASADGARSWTRVILPSQAGPQDASIDDVAIIGGIAYATSNGVIHTRHPDIGWFARSVFHAPTRLVANGAVMIAYMPRETVPYPVARSLDSGRSWMLQSTLLPLIVRLHAIVASRGVLVASGESAILRSTDNGGSWRQVTAATVPTSMRVQGTTIIGAVGATIVWSSDDGRTWKSCSDCLGSTDPSTAARVVGGDASATFVATRGGLFRATDRPDRWQRVGSSVDASRLTAICATSAGLAAAATARGSMLSSDRGATWTQSATGLSATSVHSLIHHAGFLFAGTDGGLYATPNYGAEWRYSGLADSVVALVGIEGALFAAVPDSGVYRSTDAGRSWQRTSSGLRADRNHDIPLRTLALHWTGSRLLAGGNNGVFGSTDRGATWTGIDNDGEWFREPVRTFAQSGSRIYMATGAEGVGESGGRVYLSEDGGLTWRRLAASGRFHTSELAVSADTLVAAHVLASPQLSISRNGGASWTDVYLPVHELVTRSVDYRTGDIIVGTDAGVFRAAGGNDRFAPFRDGLESTPVLVARFDGTGMLAGTAGAGLWRRTDDGVASVGADVDVVVDRIVPASGGGVTLALADPWRSATARLFDPLGREVAASQAVDGRLDLFVTGSARGPHFLLLRVGDRVRTLPLVLE